MNILNVSLQHSILTLAAHGWSHRRIARELDLNRETVGRYLRLARSKPAISTPGSESNPAAKPAISTPGSMAGRQSLCQPWQPQIEAAVSVGLSAQRIYQDLVGDHGFTGSYQAVKRFVRHLRQTQPIPFVRMEVEPGIEAQVDFGQAAWVLVDGKRKRPHLFRIVLSHSRKGYSEAVWRQTTESFIRCLENAFRYYGGVPKTLVIDNLRAAVTRADWFDPELNAKVAEFCRHYGTVMLPTRPAMPQHKGKIEAGVKFAQNNALKGRRFESLSAQNLFLSDWESGVADTRIHGTTRQQVGKVFNAVERPQLLPLPESLFPVFEEAPRTVHRDGYIELQRSYYSVPPEYVGRQVWARWESRLVRVFNQRREVIAVHALVEPGKFATDPNHLHSPHRHVIQHGLDYLLDRARLIGAHTGSWAEAMAQQRGPIGIRVLHGLLSLAGKHPVSALERAAQIALHHGAWRLRDLRALLEQAGPPGVGKTHLAQAIGYEAIKMNFLVLYRSIFDLVRDFMKDEAFNQQDKTLRKYLKPDLVIIDDMGLKQLPKHSGEYLLEVVMRRYENRSTIMTSNRPLEEWGKLLCDVPTAGAILDRFLHHAQVIAITGKSYRVKEAPGVNRENKKSRKSNEPATAGAAS